MSCGRLQKIRAEHVVIFGMHICWKLVVKWVVTIFSLDTTEDLEVVSTELFQRICGEGVFSYNFSVTVTSLAVLNTSSHLVHLEVMLL